MKGDLNPCLSAAVAAYRTLSALLRAAFSSGTDGSKTILVFVSESWRGVATWRLSPPVWRMAPTAVGSRRHNTDTGALRIDQLFERLRSLMLESLFLFRIDFNRNFAACQFG
jgi:hypothetical protein